MKVSIKQYKTKDAVVVRRISPQQLCEEQLARISQRIKNINTSLRSA